MSNTNLLCCCSLWLQRLTQLENDAFILRLLPIQTIETLFPFVFRSVCLFQTYRTEPQHPETHNESLHRPLLSWKSLHLTLSFKKKIRFMYLLCVYACSPHTALVWKWGQFVGNHFSPSTSWGTGVKFRIWILSRRESGRGGSGRIVLNALAQRRTF